MRRRTQQKCNYAGYVRDDEKDYLDFRFYLHRPRNNRRTRVFAREIVKSCGIIRLRYTRFTFAWKIEWRKFSKAPISCREEYKCHDNRKRRQNHVHAECLMWQYKEWYYAYLLRQESLLIIYVDARDVSANDSKLLIFVNIRARQRRLCHNVLRVVCREINYYTINYYTLYEFYRN